MTATCSHPSLAFLHQQKSAGVSLRTTLKSVANASGHAWDSEPWRDGSCTRRTWAFSDEAPECDDDGCDGLMRWITLFREPWDRMRSAFYYCRSLGDQLCFMPDYSKQRSPCDFALRWGNYQFAKMSGLRWFWPEWRRLACARAVLQRPECACASR